MNGADTDTTTGAAAAKAWALARDVERARALAVVLRGAAADALGSSAFACDVHTLAGLLDELLRDACDTLADAAMTAHAGAGE